jgi:hypothetical protein
MIKKTPHGHSTEIPPIQITKGTKRAHNSFRDEQKGHDINQDRGLNKNLKLGKGDNTTADLNDDAEKNLSAGDKTTRSMPQLFNLISDLQRVDETQMEQALRNLWIVAADLNAPNEALDALEDFIMYQNNEELSELALFILSDLQKIIEMENNALGQILATEQHHDEYNHNALDYEIPDLLDNSPGISLVERNTLSDYLQDQIDDLNDQALFDPDPMHRKDAIQTVSNFRNEATLHILFSAADDPEPTNRFLALQALWFAAADGIGNRDDIWHCLQQSQRDHDLNVAQLAERAIMDIEQLEN